MIVSPPFLFFLVWLSVISLYMLGLSHVLRPLKTETLYLIVGSGALFMLGWLAARFWINGLSLKRRFVDKEKYFDVFTCRVVRRRIKFVVVFWLFCTFLEIVIFKNLPLFSALGLGPDMRYTEFGFRGLHGGLNALYFVFTIYFMGSFFYSRSKFSLAMFLLLLIWPFLLMQRMMIIAIFLQVVFFTLIVSQQSLNFRGYFKYFISFLLVILVFGYLGDFRSGREHILRLADLTFTYPEWLPSAFAWVYLYVTTPINNLNFSIEMFQDPSMFPVELLSSVLPSFARDYFFNVFNHEVEVELVTNAFNVSTVFSPMIHDFGYVLAPFLFFIMGFILFLLVSKAYTNPRYLLFWIIFLYSIVISVFSNHMFNLVFWFEALFSFYLFRR